MKRVVVEVNSPDDHRPAVGTRVETMLQEDRATLLLTTLLCLQNGDALDVSDRLIEFLVKRELDNSEPRDDIGLYDNLMQRVERTLLSVVYSACNRIQTKTAARLGIDRNTLHKKLAKHSLLEPRKESA